MQVGGQVCAVTDFAPHDAIGPNKLDERKLLLRRLLTSETLWVTSAKRVLAGDLVNSSSAIHQLSLRPCGFL